MVSLILCGIVTVLIVWVFRLKREIARQKRVEKNFKYREERFKTLFDIAPIFIDSFGKNGHCRLWNKE